ncbi:MAG: cytochrome c [Bryobacteraceae bacterium]|jgi:mono/diheme cytochrome c family protein
MQETSNTSRGPEFRKDLEAGESKSPDVIPLHRAVMREMAEPTDGFEPAPVWLILAFLSLAGWAGWYLAMNSGGFRADQYNERAGPAAAPAARKAVDPMTLGRRVYNNCVTCHQQDGGGVEGAYPPLAGSEFVTGPPEQFAAILLHGLRGPLRVRGVLYNGEMPAWGTKLSDEQIAAVMTYIRASFGNQASAVEPALVEKVRAATGTRSSPFTEAELRGIRTGG